MIVSHLCIHPISYYVEIIYRHLYLPHCPQKSSSSESPFFHQELYPPYPPRQYLNISLSGNHFYSRHSYFFNVGTHISHGNVPCMCQLFQTGISVTVTISAYVVLGVFSTVTMAS